MKTKMTRITTTALLLMALACFSLGSVQASDALPFGGSEPPRLEGTVPMPAPSTPPPVENWLDDYLSSIVDLLFYFL